MGLDATVRCRCYEEGKLKPEPVPYKDLYIDEDGYLSSRKLDEMYAKYDYRRFEARYGLLDNQFRSWLDDCCEHEYGCLCDERVGNIEGCAHFRQLIEEAGGEEEFPLLHNIWPSSNDGIYPAEKAEATLDEIDKFLAFIVHLNEWVLCESVTGQEIWRSTDNGGFTYIMGCGGAAGMEGGKVFFANGIDAPIKTTHFKQVPLCKPDMDGQQIMEIVCLDTGETTVIFDSLMPEEEVWTEHEFYVASKKAPFLHEGKYWPAETLRKLLRASKETGNPIRWC